jgi:hypothetical protein
MGAYRRGMVAWAVVCAKVVWVEKKDKPNNNMPKKNHWFGPIFLRNHFSKFYSFLTFFCW